MERVNCFRTLGKHYTETSYQEKLSKTAPDVNNTILPSVFPQYIFYEQIETLAIPGRHGNTNQWPDTPNWDLDPQLIPKQFSGPNHSGLILGFRPANERQRYLATTSLIG